MIQINCDQCETWFHKTCLGLPDTLKPMPFLCGWCQSPSTCDKLQQKSQVHLPARSNRVTSAEDEEPFFLEERALKNCRKCSGCKKNFSPKRMVTKKDKFVICHLETYAFINKARKQQTTTSNRYYHSDIKCITKNNPGFNARNVVISASTRITLSQEDFKLLEKNGVVS